MRIPSLGLLLALALPAAAAPFNAATATNQVGVELFRQLGSAGPQSNLVISPYSIESALAMAYAGADGATRSEMAVTLHFPAGDAQTTAVTEGFKQLRAALAGMAARSRDIMGRREAEAAPEAYTIENGKRVPLKGEPGGGIEWHAANRLFAQKGYPFRHEFLQLMRAGYEAPLEPLDFRHAADRARQTINHWVGEQTQEKIPQLIPAGALGDATTLVLVNALYLKAPWDKPFEPALTKPEPFHLATGETADVPMMVRGGTLAYEHRDGLTVVALEYVGRDLQFLILLPDQGTTPAQAAGRLTAADFQRWAGNGSLRHTKIELHLPKFTTRGATLPLSKPLEALGMRSAFDQPPGSANFDRIAPRKPDEYLAISEVFHQTFVAVDEKGTEAAAATAVSMSLAASFDPTKPVEVRVDRPFLFAIQQRSTGVCLFLGRIGDPR